jgi:hypothetical protein
MKKKLAKVVNFLTEKSRDAEIVCASPGLLGRKRRWFREACKIQKRIAIIVRIINFIL